MPLVATQQARFLAQDLVSPEVVFGRHNGGVGRLELLQVFTKY
jgi:hypothetical protein